MEISRVLLLVWIPIVIVLVVGNRNRDEEIVELKKLLKYRQEYLRQLELLEKENLNMIKSPYFGKLKK